MKKLLIICLLLCGCSKSQMFLRYQYDVALQNLPACSKVHAINNIYITYSLVEEDTNNVYFSHTNFYRAHYAADGRIFRTVKINER